MLKLMPEARRRFVLARHASIAPFHWLGGSSPCGDSGVDGSATTPVVVDVPAVQLLSLVVVHLSRTLLGDTRSSLLRRDDLPPQLLFDMAPTAAAVDRQIEGSIPWRVRKKMEGRNQ
jgi:hypothetical protein